MKIKVNIKDKTYSDIVDYCEYNSLNIDDFIAEMIAKGFAIERFGDVPFTKYETEPKKEEVIKPVVEEIIPEEPKAEEKSMDIVEAVESVAEEKKEEVVNIKPKKRRLS